MKNNTSSDILKHIELEHRRGAHDCLADNTLYSIDFDTFGCAVCGRTYIVK